MIMRLSNLFVGSFDKELKISLVLHVRRGRQDLSNSSFSSRKPKVICVVFIQLNGPNILCPLYFQKSPVYFFIF